MSQFLLYSSIRQTAMSGVLAAVVEQALSDILPHRVRPVEADGVEALDLDDAEAAQTLDAQ